MKHKISYQRNNVETSIHNNIPDNINCLFISLFISSPHLLYKFLKEKERPFVFPYEEPSFTFTVDVEPLRLIVNFTVSPGFLE